MNKSKKISIVIPTFNRAEYLKTAIDSALGQTYFCEIVVSDHGSTDATSSVAKAYGSQIIYIRREKDYGVHFTWLDGVMNATGEFIHFNFDDDWMAPTYIEETAKLLHEDVGIVFTATTIIDQKGHSINVEFKDFFQTGVHPGRVLEKYLLRNGTLISPGCCLLRKKDILDWLFIGEVPGSRFSYKGVGPDLLFSLGPLLKYEKFGFVNQPLAFFRAHPNSITIDSRGDSTKRKQIRNAYNESKKFYLVLKLYRFIRLQDVLFWFFNHVILFPEKLVRKFRGRK